jgi:hypothetical protein
VKLHGAAVALVTGVTRGVGRAIAVTVNCLRIDVLLASGGFVHNAPDLERSGWEPTTLGAEAALWFLRQPREVTGRILGITDLPRMDGGLRR